MFNIKLSVKQIIELKEILSRYPHIPFISDRGKQMADELFHEINKQSYEQWLKDNRC